MNKKLVTSLVALLVVAALVVGGVIYYQNSYLTTRNLVEERDPGLTQSEKDIINKVIEESKAKYNSASKEEKYKLDLAIGSSYYQLGKLKDSLAAYVDATNLFPENSVPWGEAANVAFNMNNFRDAKKYIDKALQLNPDNPTFKSLLDKIQDKLNS